MCNSTEINRAKSSLPLNKHITVFSRVTLLLFLRVIKQQKIASRHIYCACLSFSPIIYAATGIWRVCYMWLPPTERIDANGRNSLLKFWTNDLLKLWDSSSKSPLRDASNCVFINTNSNNSILFTKMTKNFLSPFSKNTVQIQSVLKSWFQLAYPYLSMISCSKDLN